MKALLITVLLMEFISISTASIAGETRHADNKVNDQVLIAEQKDGQSRLFEDGIRVWSCSSQDSLRGTVLHHPSVYDSKRVTAAWYQFHQTNINHS